MEFHRTSLRGDLLLLMAVCHNREVQCDYWDQGLCHSCTWIQTPYPHQVMRKQAEVEQLLHDVGADPVWFPPVASEETQFRTKVKLVVAGSAQHPALGILDAQRAGVDLADCPIVAEPIRIATHALRQLISQMRMEPYHVATRRGELKYIVVTSGGNDPYSPDAALMIRFVLRSRRYVSLLRTHLEQLRQAIPQAHVITANIHPVHEALVDGPEEIPLVCPDTLVMRVGDVRLELGPRAFSQTNTRIASELYRQAATWLDASYQDVPRSAADNDVTPSSFPPPPTKPATSEAVQTLPHAVASEGEHPRPELWDLYCGAGGFALHAALHGAVRVTGVEVSSDAVSAARRASAELGIDARFIVDDATTWAIRQARAPHTVIVNPPRRGLGTQLAHWLDESGVEQVLYSSCHPQTLAADLHAMPHLRAVRARLFDMFPHTAHCEVLVQLQRVLPSSR